MRHNLSDLFRLTEDHIKPAGKILARAFQDNPVFIYLIPDASERKNNLTAFCIFSYLCLIIFLSLQLFIIIQRFK